MTTETKTKNQTINTSRALKMGAALLLFTFCGCATVPPGPPPTITINTIPSGADISIQGNYVGVSPISIPMPVARIDRGDYYQNVIGRADQPLQIEAQMSKYETKIVNFGEFHAPKDKVVKDPLSWNLATKTEAGYYTFPTQITIKLVPKSGQ